MRKKVLAGVVGASVITLATLGIGASGALAYDGDSAVVTRSASTRVERRQQMQKVLDARDFDAWKALVSQSGRSKKLLGKITKDNFAKFVKMKELMRQAQVLREELGLTRKNSQKLGANW